jgi:hypothetical protein
VHNPVGAKKLDINIVMTMNAHRQMHATCKAAIELRWGTQEA